MVKMKKIGIITIVRVNNYGAELQAYALQCKLNKMGYDAELIDYLYYIHPDYKKEKNAVPQYAKHYPLVKRVKGILFPIVDTVKSYMNKAICEKLDLWHFMRLTLVFHVVMIDYRHYIIIHLSMMCIVLEVIKYGIRLVIHPLTHIF